MSEITPARQNIHEEETRYRAAVSEATAQKLGASINFINDKQHSEKQFFANGPYWYASMPQTYVDGLVFFEFDAEIINVWAYSSAPGSSGTTELDVKRATAPGGAFSSIFSTTPKFASTHATPAWVDADGTQAAGTGVTAPVLSTTNVDAGDALRFDIIQSMTGNGNEVVVGIIVHYRPR